MPVPPDIYKEDVDFTALALRYPDFAKKSVAGGTMALQSTDLGSGLKQIDSLIFRTLRASGKTPVYH